MIYFTIKQVGIKEFENQYITEISSSFCIQIYKYKMNVKMPNNKDDIELDDKNFDRFEY